jgi:progranulin
MADAGKLFYEVEQQQQLPAENGILCPDQASMCSNSATCCMLSSGKWGCCPFTGATCCGAKCCPNGYSCNQTKQQCVKKASSTAEMMTEAADVLQEEEPENLPEAPDNLAANLAYASVNEALSPFGKVWCDSKYYCQSGQTCCRRSWGKWGCCPFTGGTCCKKGKVCCPQGRRCSNPPGQCY